VVELATVATDRKSGDALGVSHGPAAAERAPAATDESTVMARSSGAAAAETVEVLSPELVLVDPSLREAWQRRPDEPSAEPADEPARSVDDTAAAVRALGRIALDADVRTRRERVRKASPLRLVAAVAAVGAIAVIGFLVADAGLDLGETPAASAPGELLVASDTALPTNPVPESRAREQAPRPVTPARVTTRPATTARRFAWAPVDDATAYHVELFLGGERVFAKTTTDAQVEIPEEWRFEGRRHELDSATYDWYVWPVVAGRRSTTAVVQATLVVRDR
jgi:hypothetical protein